MTNKEKILKIVRDRQTPDITKCPKIELVNRNTRVTYSHLIKGNTDKDYDKRLCMGHGDHYFTYIDFNGEVLEYSTIYINTNIDNYKEREWKFYTRFFIFKNDENKNVYDVNGNILSKRAVIEYGKNRQLVFLTGKYSKLFNRFASFVDHVKINKEELIKFFGTDVVRFKNGRSSSVGYWQFGAWMDLKTNGREMSKERKEILKYELKDRKKEVYEFVKTNKTDDDKYYWYSPVTYVYFDIINDDLSVFRTYHGNKTYVDSNEETFRVYIDKEGNTWAFENHDGTWGTATYKNSYVKSVLVNKDNLKNFERISYISDLIKDERQIENIVRLVCKFPFLESLWKIDCKNIYNLIVSDNRIKANIYQLFSKRCSDRILKKGTLQEITGFNIWQIKMLNDLMSGNNRYNSYPLKETIRFMNLFNIPVKDIDEESFKTIIKFANTKDNGYNGFVQYIFQFKIHGEPFESTIARLKRINNLTSTAKHNILDTLRMSYRLNAEFIRNLIEVKNEEEALRMHDLAIEIYNQAEAERRRLQAMSQAERAKELDKKRKEADKERREYEYEDENYIIRLPKEMIEIPNEGANLRHCVGGYMNEHANGNTTIMFLRKKAEADKSFYTIEIRDGKVTQIHGFANKWLAACEDGIKAIPTIWNWLKKTGIECKETILTCKSLHYGCGTEYIKLEDALEGKI